MSLRLQHLLIRITTAEGLFGVSIPIPTGLFVIQAENSYGKSTCMQAILYALGLEGMLGPSHDIPLPHVAKDYVEYDGRKIRVIESEVLLEIANHHGSVLTTQRQVVGQRQRHLITVHSGPVLSQSGTYSTESYFVRERGSATREAGFHFHLANFIGWKLPEVPTYADSNVPLYMETIFPLMFVEQKHGWSSIRGRFPTQFRIRDVNRRAVEFLLDLDAFEIAAEKITLQQLTVEVRAKWRAVVSETHRMAKLVYGAVENLPAEPVATWPPVVAPRIVVSTSEGPTTISELIGRERARLRALLMDEVPQVESVVSHSEMELRAAEEKLDATEIVIRRLLEEIQNSRVQISATENRLEALEEDLQRNKDVGRLAQLGGFVDLELAHGECPTCHQLVADSLLLQQNPDSPPMSVETNIAFLEEQKRVFRLMQRHEKESLASREQELLRLGHEAEETRSFIRALKTTLTSDIRLPSYASIEERIRLADRIRHLSEVYQAIDELLGELGEIAEGWAALEQRKINLPNGDLSEADLRTLALFENQFIGQLSTYGVSSVNPSEIKISRESYAPVNEGFDLQFDLSASDGIRLIWAYTLGLLEVAREVRTNHLGLLILDEPRQQSTKGDSMRAFLHRASAATKNGQQVVVATSEDPALLQSFLKGVPHTYKQYTEKLIAPMFNI